MACSIQKWKQVSYFLCLTVKSLRFLVTLYLKFKEKLYKILLCSPGWPWTQNPPAFASWVPRLQVCTFMFVHLFLDRRWPFCVTRLFLTPGLKWSSHPSLLITWDYSQHHLPDFPSLRGKWCQFALLCLWWHPPGCPPCAIFLWKSALLIFMTSSFLEVLPTSCSTQWCWCWCWCWPESAVIAAVLTVVSGHSVQSISFLSNSRRMIKLEVLNCFGSEVLHRLCYNALPTCSHPPTEAGKVYEYCDVDDYWCLWARSQRCPQRLCEYHVLTSVLLGEALRCRQEGGKMVART